MSTQQIKDKLNEIKQDKDGCKDSYFNILKRFEELLPPAQRIADEAEKDETKTAKQKRNEAKALTLVTDEINLIKMELKEKEEAEEKNYEKEHPYGGPMKVAGYALMAVAVIGTAAYFVMKNRR